MPTRNRRVDPRNFQSRRDFADGLTALKKAASLTNRAAAKEARLNPGTVPGWFSGTSLPQRFDELCALLRVFGVVGDDELQQWRDALEKVRGNPPLPPSPFPGMVPFKEEQAADFCGRSALLGELSQAVDAEFAGTGTGTKVVVVFGVSGAGKSSVLRAGLHVQRPHAALITPEDQPQARLEKAIAELESAPQGEQLLIVDQCEELWTQQRSDDDEAGRRRREKFLDELSRWLTGGDRVAVIGLPSAYLGDAVGDPGFPGGERSRQVRVAPMNRAELTEAIRGPVAHSPGVEIEDALVETLLDELDADEKKSESGALPRLAYALAQTWEAMERRNGSHVLTVADYQATGGIRRAVAIDADAIYDGFSASQQRAARRVMLSAVIVTGDSQARDRVRRENLRWDDIDDDDVEMVLEAYLDKRLLTEDSSGFQISHEALLKAWPRLQGWIDEDRESHRLNRQLGDEAAEWESHNRLDQYLLSQGRTQDYEAWLAGKPPVEIGQGQQQYLQASRRYHKQRTRQSRLGVLGLVVLLVIATTAAIWALVSADQARRARDESLSRQAALQWELQRGRDSALAQAIALAGYRVSPTLQARSALLDSTAVPVPRRSPTVDGPISSALSSDNAVVAVCNSDGNVRLFRADAPGHPPIATFAVPAGKLYAVAFRPGTRQLAVGGRRGAQVWDITDPAASQQLLVLPGVSGKIENLAWSPEGNELTAAADTAGTFRWSITADGKTATTTAVLPPTGPSGGQAVSTTVAYSPNGSLLATAGAGGSVELWDRRAGRNTPLAQLSLEKSNALDLAFDPTSTKLAVGTNNSNKVFIADVKDPARPSVIQRMGGFDSWVNTVAFTPDGTTVAAGSADNTIRLFDTGAPDERPARQVLPGRAIVTSLQFRGSDLISVAQDGFVRTWPLPGPLSASLGARIRTLTGNSDGTTLIAGLLGDAGDPDGLDQFSVTADGDLTKRGPRLKFNGSDHSSGASTVSVDGRVAAAATNARSVYTWDISDPDKPLLLNALPEVTSTAPAALVFTPDSRYLFVAGSNNGKQISVIDRSKPTQPQVVKTFEASNPIQLLSISADGKYLAAGTAGDIQLWKIADRPENPEHLADHPGFSANISAVRFATADLLAAGSNSGTVRLYRASDTGLKEIAALDGPTGQIQSLAFDPDTTRLAAGTADGQIWVWNITDPANPTHLATLSAYGSSVDDMVYGPHGHHLTAAGDSKVLQVWLADVDAVADTLCRYPAAQLTEDEWNHYLPGTTYQPPCT